MSHRIPQVESLLQRTLAEVLQRQISDPRISGMVSITKVKVSPDLREAQVYVSVLPEEKQTATLYGLRHAASHIQSKLRGKVKLRQLPHLEFHLDESLKKQAEVMGKIRQAMERTQGDEHDDEAPMNLPDFEEDEEDHPPTNGTP